MHRYQALIFDTKNKVSEKLKLKTDKPISKADNLEFISFYLKFFNKNISKIKINKL